MDIDTISRHDLKAKLDAGEDFTLLMTLHLWAYEAMHIPGSEHFDPRGEGFGSLAKDDEIVVYCSDEACIASQFVYRRLVDEGYTNVRRYAGGLSEWHAAGYPVEGTAAE